MRLTMRRGAIALAVLTTFGSTHATSLVANVDYAATSFGGRLQARGVTHTSNASESGIAHAEVYDTGNNQDLYAQYGDNAAYRHAGTPMQHTHARRFQPDNVGPPHEEGDNAEVFATAVPEPETYALMLAGLGLMGTIARRRNKGNAG